MDPTYYKADSEYWRTRVLLRFTYLDKDVVLEVYDPDLGKSEQVYLYAPSETYILNIVNLNRQKLMAQVTAMDLFVAGEANTTWHTFRKD